MRVAAALVASLALPVGANYAAVVPGHEALTVWGSAIKGADCVAARVDPATMRGSALRKIGCDVADRLGHSVALRFGDYSDTKPEWAYGGGSLWLYDVATTRGPLLLRFSATSGRLLRTIRMPRVFRPVLAADADGLWLGIAPNGGTPKPGPAPLYHVSADGRLAVVHREGRAALWLVARGHTLWAELLTGTTGDRIWRFDGAGARPRLLDARPPSPTTTMIYAAGSLWGIGSTKGCSRAQVFRVDPVTGARTTIATVPELDVCGAGALAYAAHALFFLNGPKLFRVSLR